MEKTPSAKETLKETKTTGVLNQADRLHKELEALELRETVRIAEAKLDICIRYFKEYPSSNCWVSLENAMARYQEIRLMELEKALDEKRGK